MIAFLLVGLGIIGFVAAAQGVQDRAADKVPPPTPPTPPRPGGMSPPKPPTKPPAPYKAPPMATKVFPAMTAALPPANAPVQRRSIPLKSLKPYKVLKGGNKIYQLAIPFNKIGNEKLFSRAPKPGYAAALIFVSLSQVSKMITVAMPIIIIKMSIANADRIQAAFKDATRQFDMNQTAAAFHYARNLAEIAGDFIAGITKVGGDVLIQSFLMPPPQQYPSTTKAAVSYWR